MESKNFLTAFRIALDVVRWFGEFETLHPMNLEDGFKRWYRKNVSAANLRVYQRAPHKIAFVNNADVLFALYVFLRGIQTAKVDVRTGAESGEDIRPIPGIDRIGNDIEYLVTAPKVMNEFYSEWETDRISDTHITLSLNNLTGIERLETTVAMGFVGSSEVSVDIFIPGSAIMQKIISQAKEVLKLPKVDASV